MTTTPALEIDAVEKHFRRFHLGPVTLAVPPGCVYGLIGPNGAGKSTLMDLIFGIGGLDAGRIRACGFDHCAQEVELKSHAGYAGPELSFSAWSKVHKVLRLMRGFRPTWDDDYAQRLLADFGMSGGERVGTLSFGARTKLALVTALAWHPRLLVLDEPTTGLDPAAKSVLFRELLAVVEDETRSVFISSHELGGLERYADRIGVLHEGRLATEGETAELLDRFARVRWREERPVRPAGLWVESAENGRLSGMIDLRECSLQQAAALGAVEVETQRLTLEEWFLLLTKKGGREG